MSDTVSTQPTLRTTGAEAPTLSIVIVNSDGLEDTLCCIESITLNPPAKPFEIILVDNCSRQPCLPIIAERFPQVRTFMAPARQGFAKNYNQGVCEACGDYVLVLNNDTLVLAGALDTLLAALCAKLHYGMVGPRLVGADDAIQPVCVRDLPTPLGYLVAQVLLDPGFPPGRIWQRRLIWRAARRATGQAPCISGACMLVTRTALERSGLLDEGFDFYYEDVEWCHRFQRHGWAVGYVAEASITHLGDQSLGKVKVWAKQSEYRSALRYFSAYYRITSPWQDLIWCSTLFNYFLRGCAMLLAEAWMGRCGYAREYLYLCAWLLGQRPTTPH